ncbi:hypothetical protein HER32_10865 [Hymenobacter sp. BT18]|uniref:hypothetical protein n=1 Tax=Hymenobacter sp. BT18 TaxID=2835648 RepID=UPI00143E421F|nr:hypothetical protein [Hymenobacter sp. BT18]QIX61652.1 hypothetical protein HER32_10865 [Hymenobacter sp. BT18]
MFVDLLLAALSLFLLIPLVTGYCACSYGRSFWLWFVLGCLLPVASLVVLAVLLHRKEMQPGERLLAEAREILASAAEEESRLWQELSPLTSTTGLRQPPLSAHR